MNTYYEGDVVRVTGTFTDEISGALTNPGLVVVTVSVNRGVTATYTGVGATIINPSPGVFYADLDTTGQQGTWCVRFTGTSGLQAVNASWFLVQPSPL